MAKYVRIASLPAGALTVENVHDYEACTQAEIARWKQQLDLVACDKPDLILTPECCDRPAMLPAAERSPYYRVRGDRVRDFFCGEAKRLHANIAYSAAREMPDGTFRNSIQMISREGKVIDAYNKYLLVIEENTQNGILYGKDCHAMQTDIGRVCGSICFDLNFDEPLALTKAQHPDITLFASNYHGGMMQQYWAYQTRSFFVSCIGTTSTASIINPVGTTVAESNNYYKYLSATINLDCKVAHLDHNMDKFAAMKRKYGALIDMDTPYGLGCTLLTCNAADMTIDDVIAEFGIELWDDYYARSMAARYIPGRIED